MRKNHLSTEIVFVLDRSGSMQGLEKETIGGYNSLLLNQKRMEGECFVTTILFDNEYEVLHERRNIHGIAPLTSRDYFARGTTALLDAIGKTIQLIKRAQQRSENRPSKTLFVITTDGMENASEEYTYTKIQQLIEQQKEHYQWEFLFLGANMDAIHTASQMGIDSHHAASYKADKKGTRKLYRVVDDMVKCMRMDEKETKDLQGAIDEEEKESNE